MNNDIVYEILKNLYNNPEENGGALLAKKILLLKKSLKKLEIFYFQKPVVFTIKKSAINISNKGQPYIIFGGLYEESTVYYLENTKSNLLYEYDDQQNYIAKIYASPEILILPESTINMYSIGNMTNLELMFASCSELDYVVGKNWDTSRVTNMSCMFEGCVVFNKNIGKNWNVASVKKMHGMFYNCLKLNKNIGKNWDMSGVNDTAFMFSGCVSLRKKIGKNWNLSNVKYIRYMLGRCKKIMRGLEKKLEFIPRHRRTNSLF
jgi:hypothetical protein